MSTISALSQRTGHLTPNAPGYTTPVFKGKDAQRAQVEKIVGQGGFVPPPLVKSEVAWFYDHLGIDDTYFTAETAEGVADHVLALYGAKVLAFTKHDPSALFIELEKINPDGSGATFIHNSKPGVTATTGPGATCEKRCACSQKEPHLSLKRRDQVSAFSEETPLKSDPQRPTERILREDLS